MCDLDSGDGCDVWQESTRVARARRSVLRHPLQLRRCACCRNFIEPGQLYLAHFSVYEGEAYSSRLCLLCAFERQEFEDAHEVGIGPSGFLGHLQECLDEEDSERWRSMLDRILQRHAQAVHQSDLSEASQ